MSKVRLVEAIAARGGCFSVPSIHSSSAAKPIALGLRASLLFPPVRWEVERRETGAGEVAGVTHLRYL